MPPAGLGHKRNQLSHVAGTLYRLSHCVTNPLICILFNGHKGGKETEAGDVNVVDIYPIVATQHLVNSLPLVNLDFPH